MDKEDRLWMVDLLHRGAIGVGDRIEEGTRVWDFFCMYDRIQNHWYTDLAGLTLNYDQLVRHISSRMANPDACVRRVLDEDWMQLTREPDGDFTVEFSKDCCPVFAKNTSDLFQMLLGIDTPQKSETVCTDCKGTGKIQLLFSEVVCDCVKGGK